MPQHIAHITLLVKNYDEAIQFYTTILGFDLIEDSKLTDDKRWVLVAPRGAEECRLLLAKAATPEQENQIGDQSGGRVFLFLYTDDFDRDYQYLLAKHVKIIRQPKLESYGQVAVFADLYGNLWDLIEPKTKESN